MRDFGLGEQPLQIPAGMAALACILRAKLCGRVYQLLRNIYEETQPWNNDSANHVTTDLRQRMIHQLRGWYAEVPPELRYENITRQMLHNSEPGIVWLMTIAEIAYWSAHFLTYKDNLWYYEPQEHLQAADTEQSGPFLRHAAIQIGRVLEQVLACNMAQFLPPQTVIQREDGFCKLELCLKVSNIVKDT
ncbi:uncharacterized protein BDV17DRAFT_286647 [Aspergillus undulatus]|uniref:uncharacterized protein n=1 Tax=Aspergillus undulatus TaxID=1810928 RepID=UPI003CCC99FB